jgi:hypothetical protein
MKIKQRGLSTLVALAIVIGSVLGLLAFVREAHAIIGRPLTPFSYAGVARRTTRRAAVVGAATVGAYGYPAPYAPAPYYW